MDLRIEKTYRSLMNAFTKLIQEYPYERITVAMLCDEAMIRRTTFYKHFSDKAAFFSFFIESLRINLQKQSDKAREEGEGDASTFGLLISFLIDHEKMMDNIFDSSMVGNMLVVMCDKVAQSIVETYREEYEAHEHQVSLEASSQFVAGGIIRLIEMWWQLGHKPEERAAFVRAANLLVQQALTL